MVDGPNEHRHGSIDRPYQPSVNASRQGNLQQATRRFTQEDARSDQGRRIVPAAVSLRLIKAQTDYENLVEAGFNPDTMDACVADHVLAKLKESA